MITEPVGPKMPIAQFNFLNNQTDILWRDSVTAEREPEVLRDPIFLMKSFNRLIITGQRKQLEEAEVNSKDTFEVRFRENCDLLKNELQSFHLLNINLQGLAYMQADKKGRQKMFIDKDKSGFKISDIKIQKSALGKETERTQVSRKILELAYALGLKKQVGLVDFGQGDQFFEREAEEPDQHLSTSQFQ
jgi:hypothetical protein